MSDIPVINLFSGSEGGLTLQSVYDLYLSLCTHVTTQAAEIKSLKAQVKKLKKKARPFILHHKAWLGLVKRKNQNKKKVLKPIKRGSVFKQGRKSVKSSKGAPTIPTNTEWDDLDMDIDDTMDYTLAQAEGKLYPKVMPEQNLVPTRVEEGTAEPEPRERNFFISSRKQIPNTTPTPTTLENDETMLTQNAERPRTTSTRSVLTLKPLPKIDPNDKGKKRIEEDEESDTESEEITKAKKKFDQIAHDEEKHADLKTKSFDEIKALYENIKAKKKIVKEDVSAKVLAKQDVEEQGTKKRKCGHMKMIARKRKRPQLDVDTKSESTPKELDQQDGEIVTWRLYEACGVCILEFKDGTIIYMLVERKYPLSKELLLLLSYGDGLYAFNLWMDLVEKKKFDVVEYDVVIKTIDVSTRVFEEMNKRGAGCWSASILWRWIVCFQPLDEAVQFDVVGFFFCFFYFSDSTSTSTVLLLSTSTSSSMKLHHSFRICLQYGCWFGGKLIQKLRQKEVDEESYVKTCSMNWGEANSVYTNYIVSSASNGKIQAGAFVFVLVGYIDYTFSLPTQVPQELSCVCSTFHVTKLKKCLSDESLVIPLEDIQIDDKLHFVEEPVEVMDREVKQLMQSRIPIIKV
ncbi:hypothetical protein Tco_1506155 [Tanacetum coccineum]